MTVTSAFCQERPSPKSPVPGSTLDGKAGDSNKVTKADKEKGSQQFWRQKMLAQQVMEAINNSSIKIRANAAGADSKVGRRSKRVASSLGHI